MMAARFVEARGAAASASEEPPRAFWLDRAAYDERLVEDFIRPLREAAAIDGGPVPPSLQLQVLERLHWYFTVDRRAAAPTQVVDAPLAEVFHARVAAVMAFIAPERLDALPSTVITEVRHALLAYHGPRLHSAVSLDAVDVEQQLVRLTYWVHGERPAERFLVDGQQVQPAFGKLRACRYFRRDLFGQRIVWLPAGPDAQSLQVELDGRPAAVGVGPQAFSSGMPTAPGDAGNRLLATARARGGNGIELQDDAGPPPGAWARWKARLAKAAARLPPICARFRDAWVFVDRERDADDSAEHLYRWVRREHPEINAWYLLRPGTPDWERLSKEGFRLMGPGPLRKLLLLNSAHVISTHPENGSGGFDRRLYGDAMRWRFTCLKHGVVQNDQSAYYRDQRFDCLIAPSPAEYEGFVADGTPYSLTAREVRRCNLPRHDRLLELAAELRPEEIDEVIVMPTWRGRLIDDDLPFDRKMALMRESEYVRTWSRVLNDPELRGLARAHGKRIVFIPHSNLIPYLTAFDVPADVEVAGKGTSIQQHLARCFAFVTDYTSVAFDVALLRRGVFYLQFDRESFYGGGHNWRPGYFDYERDGFGPVAATALELVGHLTAFVAAEGRPDDLYRTRMAGAMPDRAADACGRVFEAIRGLPLPRGRRHGRADPTCDEEARAAAA